jgi:FMN-dependent NADH-azoreductase
MSTVLYITANPKPVGASYSLTVGEEFLKAYTEKNPQDHIVRIDLYKDNIPQIDEDVFSGWWKLEGGQEFSSLNESESSKVSLIDQLCNQFMEADKYIFVTPMWNLLFPPLVKAYIDTIVIAGKTFKYTEAGPVGLLANKKALHIQATGGVYSEGPSQDYDFASKYLNGIMNFIGVNDFQKLYIEGFSQYPERADVIKQEAITNAKNLATIF